MIQGKNSELFPSPGRPKTGSLRPISSPFRVLILDSIETFRDGLVQAMLLDADFKISSQATSLDDLGKLSGLDVILLDVDFMGQNGIDICYELVNLYPSLNVVILSYHNWDILLVAAYTVRAAGFLLRRESVSTLLQEIKKIATGTIYSQDQISRINHWKRKILDHLKTLKPREWQVLWLVSDGASNQDIARHLKLSENTVEKYLNGLYDKLSIPNRSALVALVFNQHLDFFRTLKNQIITLSILASK